LGSSKKISANETAQREIRETTVAIWRVRRWDDRLIASDVVGSGTIRLVVWVAKKGR
jgi:hypothetical protein